MHPALSVIFFTTLSGAGLGLLTWVGLIYARAPLPLSREYALIPLIAGAVLLIAGLVSSLFHLGQKARAWRALSQWRSSWLSREGVAAIVTFVPVFALAGAIWFTAFDIASRVAGVALALMAVITVICTAKIYDTLKPIAAWHNGYVMPTYVLAAIYSGAWWLWTLLGLAMWSPSRGLIVGMIALAVSGLIIKLAYWRAIDRRPLAATAESLTGLGRIGANVRGFEAPNTEDNYLLREMGFVVARRHATRLRVIAAMLAFVVPGAIAAWLLTHRGGSLSAVVIALICVHAGLFVERWLFFAQARHVVAEYYRAGR